MTLQLKTSHRVVMVLALAAAIVGELAWLCVRDPKISFLPADTRAEWIVFPTAPNANTHHVADLDCIFRREFTLDAKPRTARLNVRAAKRVRLTINGRTVESGVSRNWKIISSVEIPDCLRAGTNTIEVSVSNSDGPPALWLALSLDQSVVRSDESWEASIAGSAWRHASLASVPRTPGRGNAIAGGETTLSALAAVWPVWLACAGLVLAAWVVGNWGLSRAWMRSAITTRRFSIRPGFVLLIIAAALWAALFWNNARLLPHDVGFDVGHHNQYVRYIQEHHALPLPTEGWEMFQPPLYYAISAAALSLFGLSPTDEWGLVLLRAFGMFFGVCQFTLTWLCLRVLFPGRTGLQMVGLLLAAFLPMNLYMAQYVTNEMLAATLVTASIYLCLRVMSVTAVSVLQCAAMGVCLGAAMLTKATGVLVAPFIVVALATRLAIQRASVADWLRTLGVTFVACFVVCGWHYIRIWRHFGTPLVGNWDAAFGFLWWQDNGYHTAGDYARFGRSLANPLFSGFAGFADGIYSTLWGDGLCGGVLNLNYRPPWNYDLMVAGYLLAVLPTLIVLTGATVAFRRFIRKRGAEQFVLLGLSAAVVFALGLMSLKVPSYAQAKAFYGLCALVPFCYFGAIGWDVLTRGRTSLQLMLCTALVVWAANNFASLWVRDGSAETHISLGLTCMFEGRNDAATVEFSRAIKSDKSNPQTWRYLAASLEQSGRLDEALVQAERAAQLGPNEADCHVQLGSILARQNQMERAIGEVRRAIEVGPQCAPAYVYLTGWLHATGRDAGAVNAARDGLAIAPETPELHYFLGVASAGMGDSQMATNHLARALRLRPGWAEAQSALGQVLMRAGEFVQDPSKVETLDPRPSAK